MDDAVKLLAEKNYVFNGLIIQNIDKKMPLIEFLILVYFMNNKDKGFDVEDICHSFNLEMTDTMNAFNSLISKNIIIVKNDQDLDGRINDVVDLCNLYQKVVSSFNQEVKAKQDLNLFDQIEAEFQKKLSPIECEIVNGWLDMGTSEELILGALKEASYNGVKNLRYIDKIIYEWGKKGFKTMADVDKHMKGEETKDKDNNNELFDYDWLDDDE